MSLDITNSWTYCFITFWTLYIWNPSLTTHTSTSERLQGTTSKIWCRNERHWDEGSVVSTLWSLNNTVEDMSLCSLYSRVERFKLWCLICVALKKSTLTVIMNSWDHKIEVWMFSFVSLISSLSCTLALKVVGHVLKFKPMIFCCKAQAHALEFSLAGMGIFGNKQNPQSSYSSL